jgi:plastocyanin
MMNNQGMMNMMGGNMMMGNTMMNNQQFLDNQNDGMDEKTETGANSQNIQVSIARGSASPGCEQTNECYLPYSVSVKENNSVTWTNDDMAVHTATSGIPSDGPNGIFDSGLISPGKTFTNQFDDEGTFDYYCIAHPWMTGDVVVSE